MNNKWALINFFLKFVVCFCSSTTLGDNNILSAPTREKVEEITCSKKLDTTIFNEKETKLSPDNVKPVESSSHLLTNDCKIKTILFYQEQIYLKMYKIYIQIITNFLGKFNLPIKSKIEGVNWLNEIAELLNPVVSKTFISKIISIHIDKIKELEVSLKAVSEGLNPYSTKIIPNVRKVILKEKEKLFMIKNVFKMLDCELINTIDMKYNDINVSIDKLDLFESNLNLLISFTIPELIKSIQAVKVKLIRMDVKTILLIIRIKKYINDIALMKEKNLVEINNFLSKGANFLQILKFNKKYLNFICTLYDVLFKTRELIENFDEIKKYLNRTIKDLLPI